MRRLLVQLSLPYLLVGCPQEATMPRVALLPSAGVSEPPLPSTPEPPGCVASCRTACQASDIPGKTQCEAICIAALRRPDREVVRRRVCGPTDAANSRVLSSLVKRAIAEEVEHNLEDLYDRS